MNSLPRLTLQLVRDCPNLAGEAAVEAFRTRPVRIVQFGEGNFLRAFADWMVEGANRAGVLNGHVAIVQPVPKGMAAKLREQDGLYTVLLRGVEGGSAVEHRDIVTCVRTLIDPYSDYEAMLGVARNPDLRFVVSNTTEAGIAFLPSDSRDDRPPASFPGKLTAFLYERWKTFDPDASKGLILLPCELIDRNGEALRAAVVQTAEHWRLESAFLTWVTESNTFTNTLVDRIVTGYPADEATSLAEGMGYRDELLAAGEPFHLWVIEAPDQVRREFPLDEAGYNVIWTDNLKPYRDRKVRILNGAHTSIALAGFLAGLDTVKQCVDDTVVRRFLEGALAEIIPTLDLPRPGLDSFAASVLERFGNPYVKHRLLSIALNSVAKYRARVLPSVERFVENTGTAPPHLCFALAALIAFYRGDEIRDSALIGRRGDSEYQAVEDAPVLEAFAELWRSSRTPEQIAGAVLQNATWWGRDLRAFSGLAPAVSAYLADILHRGALPAMLSAAAGS